MQAPRARISPIFFEGQYRLRTLEKIRPTRVGFSTDNMVIAPVDLDERRYDRAKAQEFYRNLAERVAALPGVQSASLVDEVPGDIIGGIRRSTEIEGYKGQAGERLHLDAALTGPRYFTNMKVPLVQGRDFDERDRDGWDKDKSTRRPAVSRKPRGKSTLLGHPVKHPPTL